MAYNSSVEQEPAYVHAKVSGDLTRPNARQFLVDAYQTCIDRNVSSLLLEMAFTGGLGLGEVCSVINEKSLDGSNLERIALRRYKSRSPARHRRIRGAGCSESSRQCSPVQYTLRSRAVVAKLGTASRSRKQSSARISR
jgi:hypothetical protein